VLRYGDNQAAARTKGLVHSRKCALVVINVLEHVEAADDVEVLTEREISRV